MQNRINILKFSKDVIINVVAAFICTFVLNIIVYPLYAKFYSAENYGSVLTAIGIINILYASLGNTLNNIRLLFNRKDSIKFNEDENYNVIINILSMVGSIIGVILIRVVLWVSLVNCILIFFTIYIGILRTYLIVEYRLELEYKKQLVSNIILVCGYLGGIVLSKQIKYWPLPFLLGNLLSLLYSIFKGKLVKEKYRINSDAKIILHEFFLLMVGNLMTNILVYLDRLLIHPILGATSVAIFSVAVFWGKCFAPFVAPIANVFLSHLTQKGAKVTIAEYIRLFLYTVFPIFILCIIGYGGAPFLTNLLYPSLVDEAHSYMMIASVGALIGNSLSLISPIIMVVCPIRTIFIMQVIQFIVYLIGALFGALYFDLYGFCVAILIINIIKVVMSFSVGYFNLKSVKDI